MKFNFVVVILALSLIVLVNLNCGDKPPPLPPPAPPGFGVVFAQDLPQYLEENSTINLLTQTVYANGDVTYQWYSNSQLYPSDKASNLIKNVGLVTNGCDKNLVIEVVATDSLGNVATATTKSKISKSVCQFLSPGTVGTAAVNKIVVDNTQGNVWVGTIVGLSLYSADTWSSFSNSSGLIGTNVTGLWIDELKDDLWLSMADTYVNRDGGLQVLHLKNGVSAGKIYAWKAGWMAGSTSIVTSSDGTVFSAKPNTDGKDGYYGVEMTEPNSTRHSQYLPIRGVTALATNSDQTYMWIGSNDSNTTGLFFKDHNKSTVQDITTNWLGGTNNHKVNTVAIDGNMVYVGLNNSGSVAGGMLVGAVHDYNDPELAVVWVGQYEKDPAAGLPESNVVKIVVGKNHQVWVATDTTISRYTVTALDTSLILAGIWKSWSAASFHLAPPSSALKITDMAYDSYNNALWVGTASHGVFRLVPSLLK